jgi:uncharacterized paraquat-inducible protein A
MTRTRSFEAERANASLQCQDCHSLALADEPYCGACGGHLGPRKKSKVAYDATATFLGVVAVILYFVARG